MACTAGKFQDGTGAMTCKVCPAGREQPNLGADKCDECQVSIVYISFEAFVDHCVRGNMTRRDTAFNDTIARTDTSLGWDSRG